MSGSGYVITVLGEMAPQLREALDGVEITTARGATRLRVAGADSSALHGVLRHVAALGLEVLDVSPGPDTEAP